MPIDVFFAQYDLLREVVAGMFEHLGKQRWKRVEVLMLMLQLNVYYRGVGKGAPFASAKWYAGNSFCSEKTVDRLVAWLKAQGFASVRRLRRRDTEAAWQARNKRGFTNEGWHELSAMNGGPDGPFKVYPEGFFSTNEIDLSSLIGKLRKLIGAALNQKVRGFRVYRGEGGVTFKAWFPAGLTKAGQWPVEGFMPLC